MKLIRYGSAGKEKPGVILPDGRWVDVSAFGEDYDETFFENNSLDDLEKWIQDRGEGLPEVPQETRLGSPIVRPSKIICIGLNYAKHAKESGMEIPEEPVIFFKSTSAIVGPNDDLVIPKNGSKADWEVELAVIIGKRATRIAKDHAMSHVFGYSVMNDVSARDNRRAGQWIFSKGQDSYAPFGPLIVTADDIPDPHDLTLWLKKNGEEKQRSNTKHLLFDIPTLISDISSGITLEPGDIIATGTPSGVGAGRDPQEWMWPGDVIECGVDGIGVLRNPVVKIGD